jgi:hypothetical protein
MKISSSRGANYYTLLFILVQIHVIQIKGIFAYSKNTHSFVLHYMGKNPSFIPRIPRIQAVQICPKTYLIPHMLEKCTV